MNNTYKISSFIVSFIKRHIKLVILLVFMIIGCAVSALLPSMALRYLIDTYLKQNIAQDIDVVKLSIISLCYFIAYFLIALFTVFENYLIDSLGQKIIHELRLEMIKKTHRLKYSFFTTHGTGEMTSRITDDVNAIETLFATGLVSLLVSLFKIIGILISVYVFSWMLGLILTVLIPLIYLITKTFRKTMLKNQLKNRKALNELNNDVSESIVNIRTIHNLNKEKYRDNRYKELLKKSYDCRNRSSYFDAIYSPIIQMIKGVLIASIALLVITSKDNEVLYLGISVGTFAASLNLIGDVFSPIENIGQELESMQEGVSGMKRVESFMSEDEIVKRDDSITSEEILKSDDIIKVKNMSFHYDDSSKLVFANVSISIKKRDRITIIGRTGAGKTTFFRLLSGIIEPSEGKILIGGVKAELIPERERKNIFGYVEQGFSSIPGTVLDQITLRDKNISKEKVEEVMKEVFLDDYVKNEIKGGYAAKFSPELFSRGQLQLLSLARALVFSPEILLLDEISANLDSQTEERLIKVLRDESETKTVISISHRLSDKLGFDKTIVVENKNAYYEE